MGFLWILIPIIAILSHTFLKAQKLEVDKLKLSPKNNEMIDKILAENKELRTRIENLEEIITGLEKEQLKDFQTSKEVVLLKHQIEQLIQKLPK